MYPSLVLLQSAPSSGNPLMGFLPLLLIVAIFYFLVFMPMQRQRKQQQQMLRELQNGDAVVTSSGIVGTIVSLADDRVVLKVKPSDIKLEFLRSAIASRETKDLKKA